MTRRTIISALALAGAIAAIALPSTAVAGRPDCDPGDFCAWTDANYEGQRVNWSGDDSWWEGTIADEDSSWQNNGYTTVEYDHVVVSATAGPGSISTICLEPGESVVYNAGANDRGDAHSWRTKCPR